MSRQEQYGLRELLDSLMRLIDPSWTGYWCFAALSFLLLTCAAVMPRNRFRAFFYSDFTFSGLIFLSLLSLRWPGLLAFEFNPDESFSIAGAMKLRIDPIYWRSFVGMTHGPLIHYPLALVSLLGLSIDYAAARTIGIGMLTVSLFATYKTLEIYFGRRLARIAILPGVAVIALFSFFDFAAYNGEHVLVLLLSCSLYLCAKLSLSERPDRAICLYLGIFLGAVPFAKIQGLPSATFIGMLACVTLWRLRTKGAILTQVFWLVFGTACLPSIFLLIAYYGDFQEFWISYVLQNLSYADRSHLSFTDKFDWYFETLYSQKSEIPYFIKWSGIWIVLAAVLFGFRRHTGRVHTHTLSIATAWLLIAIFSVVQPGNIFHHYAVLLVNPLLLLSGILLGLTAQRVAPKQQVLLAGLFLVVTAIIPSTLILRDIPRPVPKMSTHLSSLNGEALPKFIRAVTVEDDTMAVWGWADYLYVQTSLTTATRYSSMFLQEVPNPYQRHFRRRFTKDFSSAKPAVFVDAVGPGQFKFQDRTRYGHENRPALDRIVRRRYRIIGENSGCRIYVLKTRYKSMLADLNATPQYSEALIKALQTINPAAAPIFAAQFHAETGPSKRKNVETAQFVLKKMISSGNLTRSEALAAQLKALTESGAIIKSNSKSAT